MSETILHLDCIHKVFFADKTTHEVIHNLSFSMDEKAFVCILGYTGCGKTTLLRMICGFEHPNSGTIIINGKEHTNPTKDVIMLFQDTEQLFPWKTAAENIAFVIRNTIPHVNRKAARHKAYDLLDEVGLTEYAEYYPHQLSGGMRQRVAVARALAAEPKLLLMDEPFSALDELTRRRIQSLCRKVYEEREISVLFVTHSIEESLTLADKIVIMGHRDGSILAVLDNQCRTDSSKAVRDMMRARIMDYLQISENERK